MTAKGRHLQSRKIAIYMSLSLQLKWFPWNLECCRILTLKACLPKKFTR